MAKELELLKCVLSNKFIAGSIVAKLSPSWMNFATSLKHQIQVISVEFSLDMDVEEKARENDTRAKGANGDSAANVVQKNRQENFGLPPADSVALYSPLRLTAETPATILPLSSFPTDAHQHRQAVSDTSSPTSGPRRRRLVSSSSPTCSMSRLSCSDGLCEFNQPLLCTRCR